MTDPVAPTVDVDVAVVVGTRPEIIKMAPVVRALEASDRASFHLVHTNQHYDDELSDVFFENLNLPTPGTNLDIGSDTHGQQTAKGIVGVESTLLDREFDVVLAQGDTNAVLSTAIAACKLPVEFGHVEAGIRSGDWTMPEEVNRVVSDRVADLLFAPTEGAAENLADEGITESVYVTGNTVVDACLQHAPIADRRSTVLDRFELAPGEYVVATIHRPKNTDEPDRLLRIMRALDAAPLPVVLPAHPRTQAILDGVEYVPDGSLRLVEPLDYLDFLKLESDARVIVTDSGGIQEEASILEVPCLTVRPNTERPETVEAGVNKLVQPETLGAELADLLGDDRRRARMRGAPDLFGRGDAGARIVSIISGDRG